MILVGLGKRVETRIARKVCLGATLSHYLHTEVHSNSVTYTWMAAEVTRKFCYWQPVLLYTRPLYL